ncbi:uncharacterized protein LOC136024821 [Artemia franciscana]|uniref:uncharacterized protein LOC136024821 n=1 Tax=Artemia franciscana TaxID=6661 RepID=UPI0032DAEFBD
MPLVKFLGNVSITTQSNQSTPTHSTTVAPKTTSRVSILDFVFKTIGNSVILKTRRKPHRIKRSTRTLRSREKARSFGILASIKSGLLPRPAFPVGLVVPFQNPQSNPPVFTLPAVTQVPPATEAPVMPVVSPNPLPILTTVAPTTDDSPFLPPSTLEPVLPPFPATEEPGIPNQACCSSTRSAQAYFSNPRYPSSDVSSNSVCSVTVIPHSESICQLKVEFLVGRFLPPSKGVCQNQALSFSGTIWPLGIKVICGFNDGQHIYIHIDRSFPLSQRYVNFILRTSTSGQNYNMYLSIQQIDCSSSFDVQAPPGCLQYFTANFGSFSSFNFANGQYLSDTSYKICFYTPRNFCKIVCSSSNGHFMLEKFGSNELIPYTHSGVSSKYCVQDYLLIPSGSANGESPTQDRYCGGTLNPNHGVRSYQPIVAKLNGPIFTVEVKTGISSRFFAPAHTGFSVNYQLISSKCHSSGISEPCKASEATIPSHTVDYTITNPATNAPHSSVITAAPPIPTTTAIFTPNLAYGLPKPKPVYGAPINSYGAITHGPNLHEGHHLPLPSKGSYGVPQPPKQSYGVPQPPKQNYGVPQDAYSVPQSSYSALANGENQGKIDINELFNYFQQLQYWTNLFQNSPGSNNQNHGSQWLENNGNYDTAYNFPSNQYASKQKLSYGPPSNQYTNFGTPINSSSNETSSSYDAPMNSSSLSRGNDPLILPQFGPPSLAQPQFQGKYTALSPGLLPPDPIKHGDASEENEKLLRNEIRKKSIDIDSDYYDERR